MNDHGPGGLYLHPDDPGGNPGDEAPPGTPGTGEDICPSCHGTGQIDGKPCIDCGGSGTVIGGIGGG